LGMENLTFCKCFITHIDNGIKKKCLFSFPQLETKWHFYQPFLLSGARLVLKLINIICIYERILIRSFTIPSNYTAHHVFIRFTEKRIFIVIINA